MPLTAPPQVLQLLGVRVQRQAVLEALKAMVRAAHFLAANAPHPWRPQLDPQGSALLRLEALLHALATHRTSFLPDASCAEVRLRARRTRFAAQRRAM